ncbi:hypothetical protein B0H11DRAFT_2258084 [Mycena galericulata]|nr:hypothetical protein B0H11DRAFT_2258084 [Mycena galericulata]
MLLCKLFDCITKVSHYPGLLTTLYAPPRKTRIGIFVALQMRVVHRYAPVGYTLHVRRRSLVVLSQSSQLHLGLPSLSFICFVPTKGSEYRPPPPVHVYVLGLKTMHPYFSLFHSLTPTSDPSRTFLDFFVSLGSLVDFSRRLAARRGYYHLAHAAVCEILFMEPDIDEFHALFFMIWYYPVFSDNRKAVGYAWNLMNFVAKLAQGLGLHRDGSHLKVTPGTSDDAQCFLGTAHLDRRMSLFLGRPPSLSLCHDEIIDHEWKNAFFVKCLGFILEAVAAVSLPDYKDVLQLDALARDFHAPGALAEIAATARFLVMHRALVVFGRDISEVPGRVSSIAAVLQLHRRCFTEALSGTFVDLHHPYAPSVLVMSHFASLGVGIDEWYRIGGGNGGEEAFVLAQPMPFISWELRIA